MLLQSELALGCRSAEETPAEPILQVVDSLPARPIHGMTYSFGSINRKKVTEGNHGLHKYPAKFIPQIARWALSYNRTLRSEVVLDPFCGSGTTLLEAGLLGNHGVGVDVSPLAILIAVAKTARLRHMSDEFPRLVERIVESATKAGPRFSSELEHATGTEVLGLHQTWSNWFTPKAAGHLLALREAIFEIVSDEPLRAFFLVCLSSIVKKCSYLDENQIKVRFAKDKTPADPCREFRTIAAPALERQLSVSRKLEKAGADFHFHLGSSTRLPLTTGSVDRVITSPPYINAVDYTMTHKYNLFLLGLLEPKDFKSHCRDYVGLTERAVRASDLVSRPSAEHEVVQAAIDGLWDLGSAVARNRAYVVNQYFQGMLDTFRELKRVVRSGGYVVTVVGQSNSICKMKVETAEICRILALSEGFQPELSFLHEIGNRSSMRLNRAPTGGSIKLELVSVLRRP